MPESYNTLNFRMMGGSTWRIRGELSFASSGHISRTLTTLTTTLTQMRLGSMNLGSATSGVVFILPVPVAGAEVFYYSNDATSGRYNLCSNAITSDAGIVIGTATETQPFADGITYLWTTGAGMLEFRGITTARWMLTHDVASVSFGSTAANTTV